MRTYAPLEQFLISSGQDCINMTFSELERILGFTLPKSAYFYDAWWANEAFKGASIWAMDASRHETAMSVARTRIAK